MRNFVEHLVDETFCVTSTDPERLKFQIVEDDCSDYKCWKKIKKPRKWVSNFFQNRS